MPRILKGGPKKTSQIEFCFPYISIPGDRIFKMWGLPPIIPNLIMGDRHKNFEDLINWARDIQKIKFDLLGFFWATLYKTCHV